MSSSLATMSNVISAYVDKQSAEPTTRLALCTKTIVVTGITVSSSATVSPTSSTYPIDFTYEGYTPIGIVGCTFTSTYVYVAQASLTKIILKNPNSSSGSTYSGAVQVTVLYMQNEVENEEDYTETYIKDFTYTNISLPLNGGATFSTTSTTHKIDFSLEGYTPLGIIGANFSNIYGGISQFSLSKILARNFSTSSSVTGSLTVRVLYIKNKTS